MKKKEAATPLSRLEPARISIIQGSIGFFTFIISTVDIFIPYLVARQAGRDSWISVLISLVEMSLAAAVAIALTLRFPRRTLIEYVQYILGLWPGRLLGVLYIFFLLMIGATTLRELNEIMTIVFMQLTPKVVFGAATVVLSSYAVLCGVESIHRVNLVVLPAGVISLFFVVLFNMPNAEFARFLPVMENGLGPPVAGSIILFSNLIGSFGLLSLIPFVASPRKVIGAAAISIPALIGAMLLGTTAIAVLGPMSSQKLLMPALEMSRLIEIPGLPRMDMLIMVGWFSGIFIKVSLIHYLLVLLSAQLACLETYRPLIIPFGVIMVALSIYMFSSVVDLVDFIGGSYAYFLITFGFVIPFFLFLVACIRRVKDKKQTVTKE